MVGILRKFFILFVILNGLLVSRALSGDRNGEIIVYGEGPPSSSISGTRGEFIDLDDYQYEDRSLGGVLNQISGIYSKKTLSPKGEDISIRGFDGSQLKIFIDGVAIDHNSAKHSGINQIPVRMIEDIVVVKGPASSLYGNSAMGGVVLIHTKKDIDITKLAIKYGSFETRGASAQSFLKLNESSRIGFHGNYETSLGNYKVKNPVDASLFDRGAVESEYRLKNNESREYSLASHYDDEVLWVGGSFRKQRRGIPGLEGQYTETINQEQKTWRLNAQKKDIYFGGVKLRSSLWGVQQSIVYQDPLGEINGFADLSESQVKTWGGDANLDYLGWAFLIPKLMVSSQGSRFYGKDLDAYRSENFAALRLENYLFDDALLLVPSVSYGKVSTFSGETQYGVSAELEIYDNLQIFSAYETGYRYPTLEELYVNTGIVVANGSLKPERTKGFDLGIKGNLSGNKIKATGFAYQTSELIQYLLVSGFQYKPFNIARTRTEGVEINFVSQSFLGLSYACQYTWQTIKDASKSSEYYQKYIPNKPWMYGTSRIHYGLHENHSVSVVHEMAKSRFINRDNTKSLDDKYLIDVEWTSQMGTGWKVNIAARNLADRYNVDVRGYPLPSRSIFVSIEKAFI